MSSCDVDFGDLSQPRAGVSVPLFSLRTTASVGIGQYPDIVALARWCRSVGLGVIQLLPVNDTGDSSSPYSALSAFALNPVYVSIAAVPGAAPLAREVEAWRTGPGGSRRVVYREVRAKKLEWLRRIYDALVASRGAGPEIDAWAKDNPWVLPYARFVTMKGLRSGEPWWRWPAGLAAPEGEVRFHVWVQQVAARQMEEASRAAAGMGVRVMGDLPILMSHDSSDVWSNPGWFDTDFQAGAPPDMFSTEGQNWGFPPYRWDALQRDDYRFWRERIRHAGRFYHAIRIDHVLGFLRIWRVPSTERSGVLGHYNPRKLLSRADLGAFDDGRIAWLTLPHTTGAQIQHALGAEAPRVRAAHFVRLGGEDLYHLAPGVSTEEGIEQAEPPGRVRDFLLERHRDRALLDLGRGRYVPAWYHGTSTAYRSLTGGERELFDALVRAAYAESERIWEIEGRRLLSMLRSSTDMLVAAEDLGAVPDCLPPLLEELGILGLRIERWARDYKTGGHPLIPPAKYPRLSVCSPSVHDTTTLRGWWEEPGWDRETYYRALGKTGTPPSSLTPELCRAVLERAMGSTSILVLVALQDYLALSPATTRDLPGDERVNIPGTVGDHNWSYRMPLTMEELETEQGLADAIRSVVAGRGIAR